ncbi:sensor histidine kinase [Fibrella forsythiae]|uniref:Histidine kinase n=1 Tax=Fibrella forsythiae TaxID=2817061 RepID=A0ABS3JS91_9BACT|nr:sensor histidine kinase [Fibrella forsythiae]MBO0952882.1 histidine kinase [Fibrella forsythiae]
MKQWVSFDRYDILIYLLNYPAVIIANYIIFGPAYVQDGPLFTTATLIINGWALVIFLTLTSWMKYMRYSYGAPDQFGQRLLYSMLMYVGVMMVVIPLIYWSYDRFGLPYKAETIPWILMIGFVTNVISAGCHEAIFTYGQLQKSTQREFDLKQLHLQRQMEVLKQQINPHFLFNSLNSLIALIGENPSQAELFAEELSSVYRYVLRANERNLTELDSELEFIHSYAHLLRTRHGAGFELITRVDPRFGRHLLPPLTLQLLIENAVKHNVVLADQPLVIEIQTDELANLHVRNNLQPKQKDVLSNGVGLSNIIARYQMLGQPLPTVRQEAGQFVVALHLITT